MVLCIPAEDTKTVTVSPLLHRFELEAKPEPYRSKRKADALCRRCDGAIGGNWKWVEDLQRSRNWYRPNPDFL